MQNYSNEKKYINLIKTAINSIQPGYYKLETTYEPSGIVRERVFCYELYHQIRLRMGKNINLTLNGEIDKRGHIDFAEEDRKNPDFIFHIPGQHEGNTIIVEIKGKIVEEITKDFETLLTFIKKYFYKMGIFILYNHSMEDFIEAFGTRLIHYCSDQDASRVTILCKKSPDAFCEELLLPDLKEKI